jgi:type II secretion system protein N
MIHSIFSFRSLVYLAYAVLLTAVLLFVRFPAEKFKAYCEKRIERLLPGSACTIDHIVYRFPLSAAFETLKISRAIDGQESDLVVDRLVISPEPLQFWRSFKLKGEIYSGLFEAGLDFDKRAQTFQLANIHLEGLEAGDLAECIGITDRKISGIVEFSGNYQAKNSHPSDGTGKGVVQVVTGSMELLQPILALSTIEFEKVIVSVTHQNGMLSFAEGELLGKEIIADFSGELRMASPLLNSNILLSGHLEPDDGFLRNHPGEQQVVQRLMQRYKMTVLPFKLGGTLERPLFRFST